MSDSSPGTNGERYIAQRYQAHTSTHQAALQAWVTRGRPEAGYYTDFAARVKSSQEAFERESKLIEADANMNRNEKREAVATASERRVFPAWGAEREAAFEAAYGSVAGDGAFMMMLHRWRDDENWPKDAAAKTPWQETIYAALTAPQDASVPVVDPMPAEAKVEAPAPSKPVPPVGEEPVIPVPTATPINSLAMPNSAVARKLADLLKRTCEWCAEDFKNVAGKSLHQNRCDQKPQPESASVAPSNATLEEQLGVVTA